MRLAYLLIDGFALMSYAPVVEPFRAANRLGGKTRYSWRHYSVTGAPAKASNGVELSVDGAVTAMDKADIIFVCAGGNPAVFDDRQTFEALRRVERFGATLCGVSGGPFILARAGLLDGYSCTVHWEHEASFRETFIRPKLENGLFVIDRKRMTCAGGLAGLDLATTLIAASHGPSLAGMVSDWYIQTEQRQPSRPQRRSPALRYRISHDGLTRALTAMEQAMTEPLSKGALAEIAGISIRHLERLFRVTLSTTVGDHYRALRLQEAYRLLTETTASMTEVSAACGFASTSNFSKAFKNFFTVPPSTARRSSAVYTAPIRGHSDTRIDLEHGFQKAVVRMGE